MSRNDFLANEKRWRRKSLFRKPRSLPVTYCTTSLPVLITLALACLLIAGPIQADSHAPQLSSDHEVATAGFFRLSWKTTAKRVELQEANSLSFSHPKTLYTGPDSNSVISGKSNGSWYYRVRALDPQIGAWSDPVTVLVAHHDLSRALMFLSLGIIVFVGIVVLIVRGERAAT